MNKHEDIFPLLNKIDRILQAHPLSLGELLNDLQINYLPKPIKDINNFELSRFLDTYITDKNITV